jgi:hypothetical protein
LIELEPRYGADGSQISSKIRINRAGQNVVPPETQSSRTPHDTAVAPPVRQHVAEQELSFEPSSEPSKDLVASKATRRRMTDAEIGEIFEQRFWPAYPKRKGQRGKPEALKKFIAQIRAGSDAEMIIDAAATLAADWAPRIARKPAEAEFIPMAATWLNKQRFKDEASDPAPEGSGAGGAVTMFDLAIQAARKVAEREAGGNEAGRHSAYDDPGAGQQLIDG